MTAVACWFAEIAGGERHRASCPRCQARSRFDADIRRIAGPVDAHSADSGLLARAITAGLAARADGGVASVRAGAGEHWIVRHRWAGVGIGLAAVAAVAALWISRRGGSSSGEPGGEVSSIGQPLAQGAWVAVGHAQVYAIDGTVALRTGATEIWLARGQVEVDVDPEPHLPFAVRTPRFAVRVLGTQFVVSNEGVRVVRGAVEIVGADDRVVVPRLVAGERWLLAQRQASAETAARPVGDADIIELDPGSETQTASSGGQTASSGGQTAHRSTAAAVVKPKKNIHARVAELNVDISNNRDVPRARTELSQLAREASTRVERAYAEAVLAESYLRTGQPAEAQRRLTEIADRYRDLPIAESELFAASTAARRAGHTDDERTLLETYLQRYPSGALHDQARKRLDALAKSR